MLAFWTTFLQIKLGDATFLSVLSNIVWVGAPRTDSTVQINPLAFG